MGTINAAVDGIELTADATTALNIQSGGVNAIQIAAGGATTISSLTTTGSTISSGNLTFSGTAQRITGDMSNATLSNRLAFQTSTANSNTTIGVLPNGTGQTGQLNLYGSSDPANTSVFAILSSTSLSEARLASVLTGTGSYLPMTFYTGGSERVRIDTSGNVGIGTASPTSKLGVSSSGNFADILMKTASVTQGIWANESGGIGVVGTVTNHPLALYTNNGERMRIDSSGNVGIGTASPNQKLVVGGNVYCNTGNFIANRGGGGANTSGSGVELQIDGTTYAAIRQPAAETLAFYRGSGGTTETMRIDSSGNVGIGTASPAVKLHVYSSAAALRVESSSTGQPIYQTFYNGAANQTYFGIESSSGTGIIGTGAAYATLLSTVSTTPLVFGTNSAERMRITSAGNVGIGTTSPSTALQVSGTITTTGLTVSNTINGSISGNAATVTDGMYLASNQTSTGRKLFSASQNVGTMLTATGSLGGLEAVNPGGANAAFMSFHRAGAFAAYFGLDTDNQFAVGGWSSGAALSNFKCNSLGVGTAASGTTGEIRATNNVTAYYSDARLKDFKGKIGDALYKVSQLNGYYYTENEKAEEFGFNNKELQVGVSAQEVKAILPEVIAPAPFDMDAENKSKSGEDYMTVRYEKLVPLLIEAIKELKAEVEALKAAK